MKKLSGIDASFLYNETIDAPQHIGSIQYLDVDPNKRTSFFSDLRQQLISRVHLLPYLTERLQFMPGNIDHPVWVRDTTFDIDNHLHHVSLEGASRADLEKICSELYEPRLDRRKPLWQMYVIDGLASGETVVLSKTHHACLDGMASVAANETLADRSPEPADVAPVPQDFWDAETHSTSDLMRHAWQNLGRYQMQAALRWPEQISATKQRQARETRDAADFATSAPKAPWNGSINAQRGIAGAHFSLPLLKAVGREVGAKLNDVVLAITSEALNRYCAQQKASVDESLLAGCPVSLRRRGDREMNNQVTMMTVSLESDTEDLVERMRAIRASSLAAKERLKAVDSRAAIDFGAPFLPAQWQALSASPQLSQMADWSPRTPTNLVVSNVPGPRQTLFLAGAEVTGSTPLSIVAHGAGLNVTVASYVDRLDLGLTAAKKLIPDITTLRDIFEVVAEELVQRVFGVSTDEWHAPAQTPVAA